MAPLPAAMRAALQVWPPTQLPAPQARPPLPQLALAAPWAPLQHAPLAAQAAQAAQPQAPQKRAVPRQAERPWRAVPRVPAQLTHLPLLQPALRPALRPGLQPAALQPRGQAQSAKLLVDEPRLLPPLAQQLVPQAQLQQAAATTRRARFAGTCARWPGPSSGSAAALAALAARARAAERVWAAQPPSPRAPPPRAAPACASRRSRAPRSCPET